MLFPDVSRSAARVLRESGVDLERFLDAHALRLDEYRLQGEDVGAYSSHVTNKITGEKVTAFTVVETGETTVRTEFEGRLSMRPYIENLARMLVVGRGRPETPENLAEETEYVRRYCFDPDCK